MINLAQALTVALGLAATANALQATILADDNRDGRVDLQDNNENKGKWDPLRGPYLMPNIGDTGKRCSQISNRFSNKQLGQCNDAMGNVQRNTKYLALVNLLKNTDLSSKAEGFLNLIASSKAQEKNVMDNVRLFRLKKGGDKKKADDWVFFDTARDKLSAEDLQEDIQLGIDARDFSRPGGWDGLVTVEHGIKDGDKTSVDNVQFRAAPLLINNNLQALEKLYTVSEKDLVEPVLRAAHKQFVSSLKGHVKERNIAGGLIEFDHKTRWIQDWFQSGYASIPGPDGPVVLRVLLMANSFVLAFNPQANKYGVAPEDTENYPSRKVFLEMRSDDVGAVQVSFPADYDAAMKYNAMRLELTGNLEGIPPFQIGDKSYPKGGFIVGTNRAVLDKQGKPHVPAAAAFLQSQADDILQVKTDIGYLQNSHIDEIMHILPCENELGFVVAFADPAAGMDLLAKYPNLVAMPKPDNIYSKSGLRWGRTRLVSEVVKSRDLKTINAHVHDRVEQNIADFMKQTGIDKKYIIRIPTVFHHVDQKEAQYDEAFTLFHGDDKTPALPQPVAEVRAASLFGNIVNGMLLDSKHFLAPKPWGPEAAGRSVFEQAAVEKFKEVGIEINFMDDWWTHHIHVGEIHCGTNGLRDSSNEWWLPMNMRAASTHTDTTATIGSSSSSNSNSNPKPEQDAETVTDSSDSEKSDNSDRESDSDTDASDYNDSNCQVDNSGKPSSCGIS